MESENLVKNLGIIAGICAISSAFLWWWWGIGPSLVYGFSLIDSILYLFDNSWPVLLNPSSNMLLIIYYPIASCYGSCCLGRRTRSWRYQFDATLVN